MKAETEKMLDLIIELQALAQAGLYYGKDVFDLERYTRMREISAEMMSLLTQEPLEKITRLFCFEQGYQTPKLDTRAAIFNEEGQILLVQEKDGKWSLPGGWVDIDTSIQENTIKEVWEEAGLHVACDDLIAVLDRDKYNLPRYPFKVIKVFVACHVLDGEFQANSETIASGYFSLENLPPMAEAKNNPKQVELCFQAKAATDWKVLFD